MFPFSIVSQQRKQRKVFHAFLKKCLLFKYEMIAKYKPFVFIVGVLELANLLLCQIYLQQYKLGVLSSCISILQKLFLDSLRKALAGHGGSRQLTESAAIACVKLCKASTYINWEDNSVIFLLVQSMVVDLKVICCSFPSIDFKKIKWITFLYKYSAEDNC